MMSIDDQIQKYEALAAAVTSSLKAYRAYYDGLLNICFNDDGTAKTLQIDVQGEIIDYPMALLTEFPEPPRIDQITIASKDDVKSD